MPPAQSTGANCMRRVAGHVRHRLTRATTRPVRTATANSDWIELKTLK